MYDELVKELRDSAEWADRLALLMGRAEGDAHAPIMREAADAIEELSKPRWIPVTERLPDTPGEYMVAYHPCYWDRVHDEIKVGLDSFRGKTSWAKKKYQRVTHWMPLPSTEGLNET